ncbi:MAG: DUF5666 domain-containing protein, partial [Acidithiobacillus sp.]
VGQSVVVRGTYADGRAQIESVTPAALAAQDVGNQVSLVGYLDRGDNGWTSDGMALDQNGRTIYHNGDAADMRAGSLVAISGQVKAPGVIAVESVTFRVNPMDFDLPALPRPQIRPEIGRPEIEAPEIERPEIASPEVPQVVRPQVERPDVTD